MFTFKDLIQQRRSRRAYTPEPIADADLHTILRAALMSPTGHGLRAWRFTVVRDGDTLAALAHLKPTGALMLAEAAAAVVVSCSEADDPLWVEDCAIAAVSMQYQAQELGLGSCWVQVRGYKTSDGADSEACVRRLAGITDDAQRVLCVVALGHAADERKPQDEERLKWDHVKMQ